MRAGAHETRSTQRSPERLAGAVFGAIFGGALTGMVLLISSVRGKDFSIAALFGLSVHQMLFLCALIFAILGFVVGANRLGAWLEATMDLFSRHRR